MRELRGAGDLALPGSSDPVLSRQVHGTAAMTSRKAEFDWAEVPYPDKIEGHAQPLADDDDHAPHLFLYVPDLASETGWAGHRVPERKPERIERRQMGFRR